MFKNHFRVFTIILIFNIDSYEIFVVYMLYFYIKF